MQERNGVKTGVVGGGVAGKMWRCKEAEDVVDNGKWWAMGGMVKGEVW